MIKRFTSRVLSDRFAQEKKAEYCQTGLHVKRRKVDEVVVEIIYTILEMVHKTTPDKPYTYASVRCLYTNIDLKL